MKASFLAATLILALATPAAAAASATAAAEVQQLQLDSAGLQKLLQKASSSSAKGAAPDRLAFPVESHAVTQGYGMRMHPVLKREIMHQGVDFKLEQGAKVMAAGNGTVIYAGWYGGYGKVVIVDHGHGLTSLYAHLDSYGVAAGAVVKAGQAIGAVGSSGMSTSPHLHFELRRDGQPVDPAPLFARS